MLKSEVVQSSVEDTRIEEVEEIEEGRKTGIDVMGDAPWGTHFCQFYETKEDLIDILVPYFKAGLENNEFCMWVTSDPLTQEEAIEAMRNAVPDFDRYLKRGQIKIIPHTEWFLKDGVFDLQRVLNAWIDKLNQALAEGYDGLRVTGNTAWLEKNDWRSFADYEEEVNNAISKYRMLAICTYSLQECGASEVIDVVRNHQFALVKRGGEWELIESSEPKQMKEALRESAERYRDIVENAKDTIMTLDPEGNITFVNRVVEEYGFQRDEIIGKSITEFVSEEYLPKLTKEFAKVIRGKPVEGEIEITTPKGNILSEYRSNPIRRGNKVIGSQTILRDITERKRVEKALRESEVKFKNIFESASDAMIYLDKSGRILDANPKAVEVFGGSKKEFLGKHFTRVGIFSVRDVPQLMKNFANILTNKEVSIDLTIKNKKGKEIPLECSASLMKTGVMVIARDVTEKKKAEERLKFLKEFNERIIDSLGDAILIIDPYEYTILRVNEAALKQLKLRKEDLVGKTCYEKTHHRSTPCKSPHHICPIREVLKTGKAVKVEHTHFDKDNNKIVVEISAAPLRNEKGKIVQIVHLARDVTEKRIAEEKLRVMFESINDGVAIIDLEGNVVDANKAHLRMFGYNRKEELVGQNAFDSIAEKDRAIAMEGMMKMFEEEHSAPTEYTLRDKDGREFYAELTAALLHDSSGNPVGVVSVTRDITERKEMEKKLEEYSHQLEELVEKRTRQLKETQEQLLKAERLAAIGQVATMVGHDLRNPLQSIENATYYLNNELEHLLVPQKTKEMLQVLNDSVNYADRIIRDLQDFSTKKKPTLTKTNINAIVKKILSQTKVPQNVKLIIKLNRLPEIEADKEMITRVFLNLATNALHAMEDGGTLKVSSRRTNGFIEVSFKDTGIGIPKEKMEKLFTPFFTTKAKGMGMGLPICKKFVDAHRGSITVESKEGKGSTFTVRLPTKQ